jgi:type III secretory pathway component EscU
MLQRIRWAAVGCIVFMVLAIAATVTGVKDLGVVFALQAIAFAILSLNESQ